MESGYNDRDISLDIQGGTFESEKGATVLYFAKEGESTTVSRDIAISGGTFVGEPPAAEFIVAGVGLQLDKDGNMVAVSAQLVPNADKVVDGAYVYDVASGKEITEADLLALMGMNVDVEKSGYTIKVDAANLAALNKAIGAKDTSATFDFAYTAVKDGAQVLADGDAVDSVTVTVKLTDSSKPAGGNGDGSAAAPGNGDANAPSKNKASKGSMPATADGAAGIAGAAVLVGTAAAAAGAVALKRRERQ